jgi:hypothetical protein
MIDPTLCIVIPTRNRSDILHFSVGSALAVPIPGLTVLVSDNSSDPTEVSRNEALCRRLDRGNLRYIRPPRPLAMSDHWEFALGHADSDYLTIMTDRFYLWSDLYKTAFDAMRARDAELLSYCNDVIADTERWGRRIVTHPESRTFVDIPASQILDEMAGGSFSSATPRLLNTIVRRSLLERIRAVAGRICDSASPDIRFSCLALSQLDRILFFHANVITAHSTSKSNGGAFRTGVLNDAARDYLRWERSTFVHSPFPELLASSNACINEYIGAQKIVGEKLPPIRWQAVNRQIVEDVKTLRDGDHKNRQWHLLRQYGLVAGALSPPQRTVGAVKAELAKIHRRAPRLWRAAERIVEQAIMELGITPTLSPREFHSVEEALRYRRDHPVRPSPQFSPHHVFYLIGSAK